MMISITTKPNAKTTHAAHKSLSMPTLCGQSPSNLELTFEPSEKPVSCKRCLKSLAAEQTKW